MSFFENNPPGAPRRGFAGMPPARQKEIARMGGQAAHRQGKAHEFTVEEARRARAKRGGPSSTVAAAHSNEELP